MYVCILNLFVTSAISSGDFYYYLILYDIHENGARVIQGRGLLEVLNCFKCMIGGDQKCLLSIFVGQITVKPKHKRVFIVVIKETFSHESIPLSGDHRMNCPSYYWNTKKMRLPCLCVPCIIDLNFSLAVLFDFFFIYG